MSRKKRVIDSRLLELLKKQVAKSFGKDIRHSFECELLSQNIEKSAGYYVSPQSLRRLWKFLDSPFSPSIKTLNILSQYCGYIDWDNFEDNISKESFTRLGPKEEIHLYLDFYKIALGAEADINYHNVCRIISTRILSNSPLLESLMKPLAINPVSQVYFYERFPFIDGLCSTYTKGIRYYIENKPDEEAQVFGICLLLLGSFLSESVSKSRPYIERLALYPLQRHWHPFVIARYIGSHLLYYKMTDNGDELSRWIQEARKYGRFFLQISQIRFWKFQYYQFMICDYLNLIGEFMASFELAYPLRNIMSDEVKVEDGYFETWKIITEISKRAVEKNGLPRHLLNTTNTYSLPFISRKYFSLQILLSQLRALPPSKVKIQSQLLLEVKHLTGQTGFTYFLSLVNT